MRHDDVIGYGARATAQKAHDCIIAPDVYDVINSFDTKRRNDA
jgi:hypothetical protein